MAARVRRGLTVDVDAPDGSTVSVDVEPWFEPTDTNDVRVKARDGGGWCLRWLVRDDDAHDYEWPDGVEFKEFRDQGSRDEFLADAIERCGAERVFIVDRYEHGLVHYSPRGTVDYPDRRWDVAPCAVFVSPEDATDHEEFAKGQLDEYSSWCNGDVWGVVDREVDAEGRVVLAEECWGFIGHEYAVQELDQGFKP